MLADDELRPLENLFSKPNLDYNIHQSFLDFIVPIRGGMDAATGKGLQIFS